jgi:2-succinyl-5-enolpyruvyl-6-hydroxy-3-cyclohexene-1-carboxylate synthase
MSNSQTIISSAKKGVQILLSQCIELGLKHVVISPGSRNAPLIIAFNQHPDIQTYVIPDERSAAFYALGMAQQLNQPVAVLCTSGSAPLNYYPAIAEAYYQQIPLIVFTADRPQAWVDQGDGQTIVQDEVFKSHIRYSVTIPENEGSKDLNWFLSRELSAAFHAATGKVKGPVHINLPFSEPLYNQSELAISNSDFKNIFALEPDTKLTHRQREKIKEIWSKSSKKMIVCGQMSPNSNLERLLSDLAKDPSVAILVENTSNLVNSDFNHCIDRSLNSISESEKADFAPDLLITIGGAVVSKRIKTFLRTFQPKAHFKIGYEFLFMDTYQSLTHTIPMDEDRFFKEILDFEIAGNSRYGLMWKQKDYLIQDKSQAFFAENSVFSDISVFNTVLDFIPESSELHMANSSVIRYCQLFDPVKSIHYRCNRGTSGIDGSTSTACGAAIVKPETWHTLITGDMSFFYDSNALWNHLLTPNLRIFMINNAGGGIFKIIPGPKSTAELDDFFVFNHQFSAENICKAFQVEYTSVKSIEEIENQMTDFYAYAEDGRPKLMEIFTSSAINDQELDAFFEKVRL